MDEVIYLKFAKAAVMYDGLPEWQYIKKTRDIEGKSLIPLGYQIILMCDSIFSYKDGVTKYYKDRMGHNYQYSEEELLMIKLKSVPIRKS